MKMRNFRGIVLLAMIVGLVSLACGFSGGEDDEIPSGAAVVEVAANTSLSPWLETAVADFNAAEYENANGDQVYAVLGGVESGQAVTNLNTGAIPADLWIPEEMAWVNLLADEGEASFQGDCVSVAESPLVIAMWRPVAEALGWPGLPLGWLDVGSLAADPSSWNYYSGGELGDAFRLGHTHPGLSGSGTSTLLALVQAAQSKTEAVTMDDVAQPIVQASVGAFESGVTWFSPSTDALAQTMADRGVDYLTAAVMYENTAVHYGNGEIVPIYPLEGTFVATHPACINGSSPGINQESARIFRDYLLNDEAQATAVSFGLRPVNDNVAVGPPLDETHGVDLTQPERVFNAPTVDTIYGVQDVWQAARKPINLVMLLDTSGSMRRDKIDSMRQAAEQFVRQMGDDDYLTIIGFATEPYALVYHQPVGDGRETIIQTIRGLTAEGDTTLFDAIGDGASVIAETGSVATTNAMVVLTDGQDTRSYRYNFNDDLIQAATADGTTVFTIAYGDDADEGVLQSLAARGNGNFYLGDEASIDAIYEEMSAAFGGSVGVGR